MNVYDIFIFFNQQIENVLCYYVEIMSKCGTIKKYSGLHLIDSGTEYTFLSCTMGCSDITGIISLVITVAMTLIGFVTPYWIVNDDPPDYVLKSYHWGLIAQCRNHSCVWVFEENSNQPYLTGMFLFFCIY